MMTMDINNYYLGTPLPRFEYMKMLLSRFPEDIVQKYNLNALAVDSWVYIEIQKGMHGLKKAGLLANQLLQTRLAPFVYYLVRHTPGLWSHRTRSISFTSWWKILQFSTWESNTQSIYEMPYCALMK
jgi:hypothetical protein